MSGRTVGQRLESREITSSSCLRPDHAMYFAQVASVLSNFAVATNKGIIGVRALIVPKIVPRKSQVPIGRAGSNGRCNTIWYKSVFKGGVYETKETVWAFGGAETRRVASLEGRAAAAW